ncbi:MAG: hypothetical protein IIA66_05590 [Planctomycetes bacterium]|nr:hypothetical protein [Planctomycetota bacterium]
MIRKTLTILSLIGLLFLSVVVSGELQFVILVPVLLFLLAWAVSLASEERRRTNSSFPQSLKLGASVGLACGAGVTLFSLSCLFGAVLSYPAILLICYVLGIEQNDVYGVDDPNLGLLAVGNLLVYGVGGTAISTAFVPLHNRRRRRKKLGLCLECGYDLRGSEERCPECGSAFESSGIEELRSSMSDADG